MVVNLQKGVGLDAAQLRDLANAADLANSRVAGLTAAVEQAQKALAGLGIDASAAGLVRMSDAYATFTGQLKLATKSQQEYAEAYADVVRIAKASQGDLAQTGTLYARIADSTRELHLSQEDVSDVTEAIALGLKASGTAAGEAATAQQQLVQAFAMGKLSGEDLNSVYSAAPRLVMALADSLHMPVADLQKLAEEGELTASVLAGGLPQAMIALRGEATQMQTVGGAVTELKNGMTEYVGQQAEASGGAELLMHGLQALGDNAAIVVGAVETLLALRTVGTLAAWALQAASTASAAGVAAVAMRGLGIAAGLLSGPVGIVAGVLGLAATAWAAFGDSAKEKSEQAASAAGKSTDEIVRQLDRQAKARAAAEGLPKPGASDLAAFEREYGTAAEKAKQEVEKWEKKLGTNFTADRRQRVLDRFDPPSKSTSPSKADSLESGIKSKTVDYDVEAQFTAGMLETEKQRIRLNAELKAGTLNLTAAEQQRIEVALKGQEVAEKAFRLNESEKDVAEWIKRSTKARQDAIAVREFENAMQGKSKDAHDIAEVEFKNRRSVQEAVDTMRGAGRPVTDDMVARMQAQAAAQTRAEQDEMRDRKAREAADQLAAANKATRLGRIDDPGELARAKLEDEAAVYRERIQMAQEGSSLRKQLEAEFGIWYVNRQRTIEQEAAAARRNELTKSFEAIAQKLEAVFGRTGKALGAVGSALLDNANVHEGINERLDRAKEGAGGDQSKIDAANAKAAEERATQQVKHYGDMASAAKGFFKENSAGYKAMEGIEKAYRAAELAMALENMAKKLFFKEGEVTATTTLNATKLSGEAATSAASTTLAGTEASAWGLTAVVKAIASLPFPLNLAAGAATLAAVVALGAKLTGGMGGGGVDIAKERQEKAGTGSVLGDASAKSDSIARSLELIEQNSDMELSHTAGMLAALRSIESSVAGLGNLLVRNAGLTGKLADGQKGSAYDLGNSTAAVAATGGLIGLTLDKMTGGLVGKITGKVFSSLFGGKVTVLDTGFTASRATLGTVLTEGIDAYQYTDTKKSGGLLRGDKYRTSLTALGNEANDQITKVVKGLADSVQEAGKLLGLGGDAFTQHLNSFVVDIGKVSLKDLKGKELQEQLEAIFSKLGDDMAAFAVDGLRDFQKIGEGQFETLTRIAVDYANIDSIFASIGKTFGAVGLQSVAAREHLIELAGGIDKLAEQTASFADNYLTEDERLAPVRKYVTEQMAALNLAGIDSRDKFKAAVLALDPSKDAQQYTALMALESAFAKVYPAMNETASAAQVAADRLELEAKIYEMTHSSAEVTARDRAKELAAMDASLRPLQQRIYALQDEQAAIERVRDAATELLGGVDKAFAGLQRAVQDEKNALTTAHDAASEAMQARIDDTSSAVAKLKALSDALHGTLNQMHAPGQELFDRQSAQAQIRSALAIARAGGPLPEAEKLQNALGVVGQDAGNQFSSYVDYLRDYYRTANDIAALADLTDSRMSVEERMLKVLQDQKKAADRAYKDEMLRLDKELQKAQEQIDALKGIDNSVKSVAEALLSLSGAIAAAQANPIIASTAAITQAYQTSLNRAPEAAGLAFWQNQAANGTPIQTIVDNIANSPEAKIRGLYQKLLDREAEAAGLDFWMKQAQSGMTLEQIQAGFMNSPEYKAKHPTVSWAPGGGSATEAAESTQASRAAARSLAPDNSELAAGMQALGDAVAKQGAALNKIAQNTGRHADMYETNTAGGGPALVQVVL
ncbi:tape measure domain-containing protein [Pseudoduganella flava]|nr:tape measure protein [Pseudoduganella flava]TWI51521.1 tape measure domain-containing protein [Pseudoduganella flava]